MVPLWLLPAAALLWLLGAGGLVKLRRLGIPGVTRDAVAAFAAAAASVGSGVGCYAIGARLGDGPFFRDVGAACFFAFPALAPAALLIAARRGGTRRGSWLGAFLLSLMAVVLLGVWVVLYVKGPRGGWGFLEALVATGSVVVTYTAAGCTGWWSGRSPRGPRWGLRLALVAVASTACFVAHRATSVEGVLRLAIVDGETNRNTPARVTLRHSSGEYSVPDAALAVVSDCGTFSVHNWAPAGAVLQTRWGAYRGVQNPSTGSTDFYTEGTLAAQLRPGRYWMRVEKGPEYRLAEQEFVITPGKEEPVRVVLRRWINLPAGGWYSSDDHLHIPRPSGQGDPALAAWMQAEDIHVANMVQMGLARDVHLTPQRSFGRSSVYESGGTILAGGQENPRTHVLGHSLILGGRGWIDVPRAYLQYDQAWREARRQGALAGYAHFGIAGAEDGLALWGQDRLLDFIEVFNLGFPYYQRWYDALNLGERVTPTAGTDYPCVADLPGRERFYAQLDGALTFQAWIGAVRRGRTFVTNGPALEFSVNGSRIGDEVALEAPGAVQVGARVRFDPRRDRVDRLEILQAGRVVAVAQQTASAEITLAAEVIVSASTWLAARVSGEKAGERPADPVDPYVTYVSRLKRKADVNFRETFEEVGRPRQPRISAAHTAPVYLRVRGTPPIPEQPLARQLAQARMDLLDDLAARLDDARLGEMARSPSLGAADGVTLDDLRRNRGALLLAIRKARDHYRGIIESGER